MPGRPDPNSFATLSPGPFPRGMSTTVPKCQRGRAFGDQPSSLKMRPRPWSAQDGGASSTDWVISKSCEEMRDGERNESADPNSSPDHVEPPHRGRGGTGTDHDPHRVFH